MTLYRNQTSLGQPSLRVQSWKLVKKLQLKMCVVNDSTLCTYSSLQRWLEGLESIIPISTIKNDQKIGRSDFKGNTISQLTWFQSLQNKKF